MSKQHTSTIYNYNDGTYLNVATTRAGVKVTIGVIGMAGVGTTIELPALDAALVAEWLSVTAPSAPRPR